METLLRTPSNRDEISLSTDAALTTMVEHWVKSRVDTPIQVAGKLDDVAKHLLTLAGLLQGAVVAIIKLEPAPLKDSPYAIPAMIALVTTAFFAMLVLCTQSGYLDTHPLYASLRLDTSQNGVHSIVDSAVKKWCESITKVLRFKRIFLALAMLSLVTSMTLSVICTDYAIKHPSGTNADPPARAGSATPAH